MKLEVDNTTAQLIQELQASISGTIEGLRSGQSELSRLMQEIRRLQQDLAQSEQIDEVYDLVNKVCAGMGEKASAGQVKAAAEEVKALLAAEEKASAGQVKAAAEEVKALLADAKAETAGIQDAQGRLLENTKTLLDAQTELSAGLQHLIEAQDAAPQAVALLLEEKLRVLSALEEQFNAFSLLLSAQKDDLVRSAQNALNAANRNQTSLNAIMAYLSLPGYKRFFKGMEVPVDETPA